MTNANLQNFVSNLSPCVLFLFESQLTVSDLAKHNLQYNAAASKLASNIKRGILICISLMHKKKKKQDKFDCNDTIAIKFSDYESMLFEKYPKGTGYS